MKRPHNFDPFAPVYDDGPTAKGGVEMRRVEPMLNEPDIFMIYRDVIKPREIFDQALISTRLEVKAISFTDEEPVTP